MSVDTGSRTDTGVPLSPALAGSPTSTSLGAGPATTTWGLSSRRTRFAGIWEVRGPDASRRRDALFRRGLVLADVVALVTAFAATALFSPSALGVGWLAIGAVPMLVVCAKLAGLYDRDETLLRKTTLEEAPQLFQLSTLCALVVSLGSGRIVTGALNPPATLFFWLSLALFLILARTSSRAISMRIAPVERCLFIGDEASAAAIDAKLVGSGGVRAEVVARVDLDAVASWSTDTCSASRLDEIRELARVENVHRAIIAPRSADAGEFLNLVRTLKAVGVRVTVVPRLLEVVGSSVEFDDLHGITVMGIRRFELTRSSGAMKRWFDLVGASLGLVASSPLFLLIAIVIKLDTRGPVFFRQPRVGRGGRRLQILKFRTMVDGADAMKDSLRHRNEAMHGLFKIAEDPRITQVGRVLRKTCLDELPQLFNVLKGEMSLVGPRPLVVEEDRCVEGWHRRRLELMPGMTGPWQILGPSRVPLREMVAIDYVYVANWTLWNDIKILLRTVPHVLARRGL